MTNALRTRRHLPAACGLRRGTFCGLRRGTFCGLRRGTFPAFAVLAVLLPHRQARAQLLDRYFPANVPAYQDWFANLDTTGVGDAYTPLGVRASSFVISPSITEGIGYDSNFTGTAAPLGAPDLQSSGVVAINSDWSRNAVNATVSVDDTRYIGHPKFAYTDWTASAGGVIEYGDDEIRLGYAHLNAATLPTDAGTFGLTAPVIDQVDDLRLSDTIGPGPLTLVPALVGQLYRFTSDSAGSQATTSGLFNRDVINPSITANYQFAGGHNLVVIVNDSHVSYGSGGGTARPPDYDDVSVLAGLEYKQSALFVYRALVGYEERFAPVGPLINGQKTGGRISGPAAELDLIWTPTVLTSVTGRLVRSLQDEPTNVAQGVSDTSGQLILDYSFRRNVKLEASVQYDRASFPQGLGTQSTISASAQAAWSVSRNLSLTLRYDFTRGSDTGTGSQTSFNRNQILLQARFQL